MNTIATKFVVKGGLAVATSAAGALIGMPLVAHLGLAFSGPFSEWLTPILEKAGTKAGEILSEIGCDPLVERLRDPALRLEHVDRDALRLALQELRPTAPKDSTTWFDNWDLCLSSGEPLKLRDLKPSSINEAALPALFLEAMVTLDAEGALRQHPGGVVLREDPMSPELIAFLNAELPAALNRKFREIISKDSYKKAWTELQLEFQNFASEALQRIEAKIDVLDRKADNILQMLQQSRDQAVEEGRISGQQAAQADMARLQQEVLRLQGELAARPTDPEANQIAKLLEAGDYEAADRLKTQQIEADRKKLPRDLYELGTIKEARFDWPAALEAYREAWTLDPDPDYGFQYAYLAQLQNQYHVALGIYEQLRARYTDPKDIALTLNNLGTLYNILERPADAESSYVESLSIRRTLAASNPSRLSDVAQTQTNLAILYRDQQRFADAEASNLEALTIFRAVAGANPDEFLPKITYTLNNLASLYLDLSRSEEAERLLLESLTISRNLTASNTVPKLARVASALSDLGVLYIKTQRPEEAEGAYLEALSIRRTLASSNPSAHLPDLALTLSNLGNLFEQLGRFAEAVSLHAESLSIRRDLATSHPAAYLSEVANSLNNLGVLYGRAHPPRVEEAETSLLEALSIRRKLAEANPTRHLYAVTESLNNLGNLYQVTKRPQEAFSSYSEVLSIRRSLASSNPAAYLPSVAKALNNLAILFSSFGQARQADSFCAEAEDLLGPAWKENPQMHGNLMAEILLMRAQLLEALRGTPAGCCAIAQRALAAAYAPRLKEFIQKLVSRYCDEAT